MKIIIVGNLGYIGPCVTSSFRKNFPGVELIGFDIGYYAHCLSNATNLPEVLLDRQVYGDVRNFPEALLEGVDAVIDLAAISNDPMGKQFEDVTMEVNYRSAVRLAEMCKRNGVRNFVFASSCSVYGMASGAPKQESDSLDPLTAYARSKVATEIDLEPLADENFVITCHRFATAAGFSDRVRLDLVLNDFVAGAMINKHIEILSDGTPWRPLINPADMARSFEWSVCRKAEEGGAFLAVNTGSNEWNYQVKQLAESVVNLVPGVTMSVNESAVPDKRSYRVNFDLFKELAPNHQPLWSLERTICALRDNLSAMSFQDAEFRDSQFSRLMVLRQLQEQKLLDEDLKWTALSD